MSYLDMHIINIYLYLNKIYWAGVCFCERFIFRVDNFRPPIFLNLNLNTESFCESFINYIEISHDGKIESNNFQSPIFSPSSSSSSRLH